MTRFLTVVFAVVALLLAVVMVVNTVIFDRNCEGYLKRAADSNTVELAERNLSKALEYIEAEGLTSGYSSILWRTPDQDIGFWHENLRASVDELKAVSPGATQLERSNVLMKLRETLLDDGSKGTQVTSPANISQYPNQRFLVLGLLVALILGVLSFFASDRYY